MLTSALRELLKKYIKKNCLQNINKTLKIFVQKEKKIIKYHMEYINKRSKNIVKGTH